MLPDALGEVTKAGEYMGVRVSPGDILLPAASPEKPTNASTEQMSRIPEGARVQTQGLSWRSLLSVLGARPAWAACGDVVVLHGTETDVYEYGIYDYRRLGAIGEDTCDKITAYYHARLVHIVNGNDVATYHINDQIRLRHEDWDTGGDGCDWVDDNGYNVGVGPCIGTINPDDIRGSQGDSPATYYIRHGAFHPKGAQDRWQTYGQYSYAWFPQYDIWSPTRMATARICGEP